MDGYNGTIFAYGQTGSGKTYTMTGSTDRYVDRGMIPRSISYLFDSVRKADNQNFTIFASYLEIYNNTGYDLLSTDSTGMEQRRLEHLDKVVPFEVNGELSLKGLTLHRVKDEEELLNLLFIGDTNRIVCETPMNDVSTRSHCIFTMYIEAREANSEVKRKSKVHLVDLSGSERVAKTGLDGTRLTEACAINLSLHYLEHVIICLQKKMKGENVFVPYRNSLMTMMLKDSLGGNCLTRMVATIHPRDSNLAESISTCQFAQRVAMIKNTTTKNEIVDPDVIIAQLKRENEELKHELLNYKDANEKSELTDDDMRLAEKWVDEYVKDRSGTHPMIIHGKLMVNHTLAYFRKRFWRLEETLVDAEKTKKTVGNPKEDMEKVKKVVEVPMNLVADPRETEELKKEIARLKLLNLQKDNEISILLKMMKKADPLPAISEAQPERQLVFETVNPPVEERRASTLSDINPLGSLGSLSSPGVASKDSLLSDLQLRPREQLVNNFTSPDPKPTLPPSPFSHLFLEDPIVTLQDLQSPKYCFELFRKHYRLTSKIDDDIASLQILYENGKGLGRRLKELKERIDLCKEELEVIRRKTEIANVGKPYTGLTPLSEREETLHQKIVSDKKEYLARCEDLKSVKNEIERMENDIKRRRSSMQKDFQTWMEHLKTTLSETRNENRSSNLPRESLTVSMGTAKEISSTTMADSRKEISSTHFLKAPAGTQSKPAFSMRDVEEDIQSFYQARNDAFKKMRSS